MNTFENGILKAHSEALKSPLDKAHGAVIINDNKIIGFGHNYPRHGTITSKIKYCIL
jgi:deoxycytidylate deaminase